MKFAIVETVVTPGGHEIDYDRILVEELASLGHAVEFYVPAGHNFKWNYGVPVHYLPGSGVNYAGAKGLKKAGLALKREINRRRWYQSMYQNACERKFDAIIFPSATYRYLKGLHQTSLLKSPVPVLFIMHGLTPAEAKNTFVQAENVLQNPHIQIAVQTFAKEELQTNIANIHYFSPPTYIPRDIEFVPEFKPHSPLRLGFFGQYRREKRLDLFLDICLSCDFKSPVQLIIQGATQTAADAEDFQRIIDHYSQYKWITFINKPLIGKEWQQAISEIDAMMIPYSNPRYRYHTSAMLSTAIGFYKPVLIDNMINPEVLNDYKIGIDFDGNDKNQLKSALEKFVNEFSENASMYSQELKKANEAFAPRKLAGQIAKIASEHQNLQFNPKIT